MLSSTSTTTERVYVLLREASELIHTRPDPRRGPVLDFFVTSMELQALAFVEAPTDEGVGDYPDSVEECVRQAMAETLTWDLDELPAEAAQFLLDLSDLHRELTSLR